MEAESTQPIFKRKKSRPSRVRGLDEDTPDPSMMEDDGNAESPMTLATKLKNKHKARAKPQAKLSFGGDDEEGSGNSFKVRKSELSRKMKLGGGLASPDVHTAPDRSTMDSNRSAGAMYTAEYLNALKASTSVRYRGENAPDSEVAGVGVVFNAGELENMGVVEDFENVSFASPQLHGLYTSGAERKSLSDLDAGGRLLLPDSTIVAEAKKKRERLRATGMQGEEFISLSLTKRTEGDIGPHPESRLMREDDDLGEGDDDLAEYTGAKERIALGKKSKKAEASRRRAGMVEMIDDAEQDDDDEAKEWESAQLRRNVGQEGGQGPSLQKAVYKPAPIPTTATIPNLDSSISSLAAHLVALTTSHAKPTSGMSAMSDERSALDTKEINLRKMVEEAESKRAWFKAFKDWIESVADFLDAKSPHLEKLEEEHASLIAERSELIRRRREEDDSDDACLFLELPTKPVSEARVDDMGRTIPQLAELGPHAPSREARRSARLQRHRHHHTLEDEGYSTDSSLSPADAEDFSQAMQQLRERTSEILDDVQAKEFKDGSLAVGQRFDAWRKAYTESYTGAWGGLGAVGAWEFWTKLEIVGWDPLRDTRKSLDEFKWYTDIYVYSRPKNSGDDAMDEDEEDEPPLGPDGDLVGSMISTAVLPRISALVSRGAFDPYSLKHVRTVIELAEQVEMSVSRDDAKFQYFLQVVSKSLFSAVQDTEDLIGGSSSQPGSARFDPAAIPARKRFLVRRLKLLTVLLKWRKYCGERFGIREYIDRLVKEVMLPVAQSGWDVGGSEVVDKVLLMLPGDLAMPDVVSQIASM